MDVKNKFQLFVFKLELAWDSFLVAMDPVPYSITS